MLPFFGKLRVRLVLLTLLALLPLGVIAMGQAVRSADINRDRIQQSLIDATNVAAVDQSAKIKQAVGAGEGLAAIVPVVDLDTCRAAMSQLLRSNPNYAFAGFIRIDGVLECSSSGDLVMDFSEFPSWQAAVDRSDTFVEVNADGTVSGQSVVIVNVPVRDAGEMLGFVSLSLPRTAVTSAAPFEDSEDVALFGVATSGAVFSLSKGATDVAQYLPRDMSPSDLRDKAGRIFFATDRAGERRAFSVTETVADSFFIVGSWPRSVVFGNEQWKQALTPVLFAVLMWVASMSVASFGLDRMVLRHLADLRSAMRQFALGERHSEGLSLNNAPNEFKDAERAFNRMALLITEAEAARLTDLHDKEVLLREVHHRVKNNLQMIASIMNLQARAARTDDVRDVLASLQRRVRGLAMLHRSLYTQPETSQVDARDLVSAVVSDTSAILPDQALAIETDLSSALLYPDQAVPLSMWVTEALTNAVKYVGRSPDGAASITVTMRTDVPGEVALEIANTLGAPLVASPTGVESTGLGAKLMLAFCRQLDGQVETEETDHLYVHVLRFAVQDFDPEPADLVSEEREAARVG
ncbi:sensor histidine kinase [uncultured Tateyamaria sp.]|uniref:sensor histidine kinase n=1 Tax=uncultured Tateyamaria sp. TaxID=455651 RepID=UPI00262C6EFB|nr:sensor histidine kinase [uncultured Tateyamaria sp.]